MKRVEVLMLQTTRPRGGIQLLMGETYLLQETLAESLVARGRAEIVERTPLPTARRRPQKAAQPTTDQANEIQPVE